MITVEMLNEIKTMLASHVSMKPTLGKVEVTYRGATRVTVTVYQWNGFVRKVTLARIEADLDRMGLMLANFAFEQLMIEFEITMRPKGA